MRKTKKVMALALAAMMIGSLAGCGVNVSKKDSTTAAAPVAESTTAAETVATAKGEKVVLKVVDWSDSTKVRREAFHKKFMEENPDVTIEYTVLTGDQFKETVISAIKAGNAPDLFPIPSGMKLSSVVDENWYMPMNEYVTDEFLGSFGDGALNEGITTLDGKVYVLPEAANIINTLMFYNKDVLKEAGIDETKLPKTWSEFSAVCKKVTEAGKGKFYGIIDSGAQTNRLELELRSLASTAGAKCSDISQLMLVDGQNTMNSPAMVQAFDFFNSLVQDGSFHPDSVTLKAPEARALFAQNQAAFLVQGSWCISTWRKDNPELNFGVMPLPVPDAGAAGKLPYVGAQPWMGISANCAHPDVAAKYLMALYSEDYQAGLVEDGGFVSVIDSVNKTAMTDEAMLAYYELNGEAAALAPDPIVAKPATALVYAEVSAISPSLGEIAQGVLAKSVDYKAELATLAESTQAEWTRAIAAVAATGADVSAADFEFKNWDPMKNYTSDLYGAR
ncbi:MAG: sugar ABC transporter substrate-binding protein [Hungatella sp.]